MKRRTWYVFIQKNGLVRDVWNEDMRPDDEEVKVTEISPGECVVKKDLMRKIYDYLNDDIATLECESRVRTMDEETWETAMFIRDLMDEELKECLGNAPIPPPKKP